VPAKSLHSQYPARRAVVTAPTADGPGGQDEGRRSGRLLGAHIPLVLVSGLSGLVILALLILPGAGRGGSAAASPSGASLGAAPGPPVRGDSRPLTPTGRAGGRVAAEVVTGVEATATAGPTTTPVPPATKVTPVPPATRVTLVPPATRVTPVPPVPPATPAPPATKVTRVPPATPPCAVALAYLATYAKPGFAHFCRPAPLEVGIAHAVAVTCVPGSRFHCPDGVAEIIIADPACAVSYENEASNSYWDFSEGGVVTPGTVQNGRTWDPYGSCP
jgi:hypothetical protein